MGLIGDFVNSIGAENVNVPLLMLVAVRVEIKLSTAARRCFARTVDKKRPINAATINAATNKVLLPVWCLIRIWWAEWLHDRNKKTALTLRASAVFVENEKKL
jgi:hypothetical protein